MHLIATLMAGVAGAESGTATLYLRGTTTVATYYTDFEGTAPYLGTSIALDARGGASVYVDSVVRVIVRDAGGVTVRDYVDGVASTAVEVVSPAFVGNAYSGGASAAGNPTTLRAVLDKWFTSAGATDFNVLMNGASASLQTALAAVTGLGLYVVTNPTYGAVGDGVTNDRAAIQAAINAANAAGGGVVFFPSGTYRCASALTTYATVTLRGVHKSRSVIKIDHNASEHFVGAAPAGFEDLAFTLNIARTFAIIDIIDGSSTRFERCLFTASVATASFVTGSSLSLPTIAFTSCEFEVSGTVAGTLIDTASYTTITGCRFKVSGSFTGSLLGPTMTGLALTGTVFDFTSFSGGAAIAVEAITGTVTGCYFVCLYSGVGVTFIGAATNAGITEYGNVFGKITFDTITYATKAYDNRSLGTRLVSKRTLSHAGGVTSDTLDVLTYGSVVLRNTGAPGANFTINFTTAPIAAPLHLAVHNDTGSSITYAWGTNHAMSGTTFAVAANSVRCFSLMNVDFDGASCKWHTVADAAGAQENE